jgi:hypothetical protein
MRFIPVGMRTKITDPDAIVVNTCAGNDTAERGTPARWVWANPTNRATPHTHKGVTFPSTEAAWQGTKLRPGQTEPDTSGNWRKGKGKRPTGAWNGDEPPITNPGDARRAIYIPAFRAQINHWLRDETVCNWIDQLRAQPHNVYLRDHDTGQGITRNGPMSHAWLLAAWLNGEAPEGEGL